MPNPLQPLSLGVPAFQGLNTERQTSILDPSWATEANNAIFDSSGRIAARKGWTSQSTVTGTVRSLIEWTTGGMIAGAGNKIWLDGADATGTITTPSGDNWQFVEYNDKVIGFQDSHDPIVCSGTTSADLGATHGGAMPTTWSGVGLAAYGRLWVMDADKQVLKYSALLDETNFDASGTLSDATAGFFDLKSVWKNGLDQVQALAAHNGNLIIFGKRGILVYNNPTLPYSAMALVEDVQGIGCIARDTVQAVGEDLWFLSSSGVRSLGRTIVKDKMPLSDYSRNVRSYLVEHVVPVNNKISIKATYNEKEGFYILSTPSSGRVFIFDVRAPLEDGSVRVTTWTSNLPTALYSKANGDLIFGQSNAIGKYATYADNGSAFTFSYTSGWMTVGQSNGTQYVLPKKLKTIVFSGGANTINFTWKFDFSTTGFSASKALSSITPDEWGTAEYGIGEFGGGGGLATLNIPMRGHGNLFKVELNSSVTSQLAIQKFDIYAKLGRTS